MSDSVIFYVLDVSNVNKPTVRTSITVHDDSTVHVCKNEHSVDISKLTWILGNNCKLDCMSKLSTQMSHFRLNILHSVHDKQMMSKNSCMSLVWTANLQLHKLRLRATTTMTTAMIK